RDCEKEDTIEVGVADYGEECLCYSGGVNRGPTCSHCCKRVLYAGDIQYHVNDVLLFRVARLVCSAAVGCAACHHFGCGCGVAIAWCNRYHVLCESVEVLGEGCIFLTDRNPGD